MDVINYYKQALKEKGYDSDAAQQQAVERLQQLFNEVMIYREEANQSIFQRLFSKSKEKTPPKGVYLWGGVGRG